MSLPATGMPNKWEKWSSEHKWSGVGTDAPNRVVGGDDE